MSFFSDPELFLVWGRTMGEKFRVFKIQAEFGSPLTSKYFHTHEALNFSEHLSLPHNRESDFEALFDYLKKHDKYVNCKGHAIDWVAPDEHSTSFTYTWSHELLSLPSYGVHATPQQGNDQSVAAAAKLDQVTRSGGPADREMNADEKLQALEKRVADLLEQLNREKSEKQALQKQVKDLTAKLEECCAKGGSA